jgi:DNA-binding CsgD family transcriptional regulator
MLEYTSYTTFVLTVGLAAFGIMLAIDTRKHYPQQLTTALIYYQVFAAAFGFYGLWGQAVFKIYIDELLNAEVRARVSTVATLQGFPFMILAWYMLSRFTRELLQKKTGAAFNILFVLFSAISFGALIWFISQPDAEPGLFYYIFYTALSIIIQGGIVISLIFLKPGNKRINRKKLFLLSLFILLLTSGQLLILNMSGMASYFALGFILLFYMLHAGVIIILRYSNALSPLRNTGNTSMTFRQFCMEHEISPRESDIIKEICKGLTNSEISESLFISIQTVKDHTHRIYVKTGSRNRVELINRLKGVL